MHLFAAAYPERVACVYADNPVCDFKSWPAGWGSSIGDAEAWARCLAAWELDDESAREHAGNPIDSLIYRCPGFSSFETIDPSDMTVTGIRLSGDVFSEPLSLVFNETSGDFLLADRQGGLIGRGVPATSTASRRTA